MLTSIPPSRNPIQVLKDVVFALFVRELKTRFGAYRLGLLWALLEPLSFVLIISAIRSARKTGSIFGGEVYEIPTPIFFVLGYTAYKLFSNLFSKCAAAVQANQGLFAYRQVRPIDAIIARVVLEVLVLITVLLLFMGIFWWFGFNVRFTLPLEFFVAFSLLTVLGGSMGLISCVTQIRFPEISKVLPLLNRPLFIISGVFFSLKEIPPEYHKYLLWNPVLHAVEIIRDTCYPGYKVDSVSMGYLAAIAFSALFLGMALYRLDWKRMVST